MLVTVLHRSQENKLEGVVELVHDPAIWNLGRSKSLQVTISLSFEYQIFVGSVKYKHTVSLE